MFYYQHLNSHVLHLFDLALLIYFEEHLECLVLLLRRLPKYICTCVIIEALWANWVDRHAYILVCMGIVQAYMHYVQLTVTLHVQNLPVILVKVIPLMYSLDIQHTCAQVLMCHRNEGCCLWNQKVPLQAESGTKIDFQSACRQ